MNEVLKSSTFLSYGVDSIIEAYRPRYRYRRKAVYGGNVEREIPFANEEAAHRKKAEYWLSVGNADYAEGSLRKAGKWAQKRRELEYKLQGPYPKTQIQVLMDEHFEKLGKDMAKAMESALIYGE